MQDLILESRKSFLPTQYLLLPVHRRAAHRYVFIMHRPWHSSTNHVPSEEYDVDPELWPVLHFVGHRSIFIWKSVVVFFRFLNRWHRMRLRNHTCFYFSSVIKYNAAWLPFFSMQLCQKTDTIALVNMPHCAVLSHCILVTFANDLLSVFTTVQKLYQSTVYLVWTHIYGYLEQSNAMRSLLAVYCK